MQSVENHWRKHRGFKLSGYVSDGVLLALVRNKKNKIVLGLAFFDAADVEVVLLGISLLPGKSHCYTAIHRLSKTCFVTVDRFIFSETLWR